jgi:hypothetical protein
MGGPNGTGPTARGGRRHLPPLVTRTVGPFCTAAQQVQYAKKLRPSWPYDVKHLLDAEMVGRPSPYYLLLLLFIFVVSRAY